MLFPWPNPALNVSKLFNELVRLPRMPGKLITHEKPFAHLRTHDASRSSFSPHCSRLMAAHSHVNFSPVTDSVTGRRRFFVFRRTLIGSFYETNRIVEGI